MTVEIKSDGSLFDEFFRLKHEIIKKYGVEPGGDIRNATAEKMLIEQAYLKGYIDGKAEATQWIPCSERLPDKNGSYLVSFKEAITNSYGLCVKYWSGEEQRWRPCNYAPSVNWQAWMPLPEPYKVGDQE